MSAKPKRGLGRGLSALIADAGFADDKNSLTDIEISRIRPRTDQPRTHFNPVAMAELVESVRAQGVLQPLLVTPRGEYFELIAGERRLRAAIKANLVTVPCRILENLTESQILEISLVENLQREDLNPVELAHGYRRLAEDLGYSHKQIGERVGKERATVANTIRLLKLPKPVLNLVEEGRISAGHARAILTLDNERQQVEAARKILDKGLSVRQIEKMTANPTVAKHPGSKDRKGDIHSRKLAEETEAYLGLPVNIHHRGPGGKLIVSYKNLDQLDKLIGILQGKKPDSR